LDPVTASLAKLTRCEVKGDRRLVSPLGNMSKTRVYAPRPSPTAVITVLLIDGMLNPKSGWGRNLLDGVEDVLINDKRTFIRSNRPAGGASFPESWFRDQIGRAHLAITAVGD
jgi:hypothetical protein